LASYVPLQQRNLGTAIFRVRDIVAILTEEFKEAAMGIESGHFSKSGSGQGRSARGRERAKTVNEAGWVRRKVGRRRCGEWLKAAAAS
jgi:hypothetical protein